MTMTSRHAYANTPSREELEELITSAWAHAESLYQRSEELAAEAERWEDRARTLEMELAQL
jgi:predicted nuclease with TOPRIM domain